MAQSDKNADKNAEKNADKNAEKKATSPQKSSPKSSPKSAVTEKLEKSQEKAAGGCLGVLGTLLVVVGGCVVVLGMFLVVVVFSPLFLFLFSIMYTIGWYYCFINAAVNKRYAPAILLCIPFSSFIYLFIYPFVEIEDEKAKRTGKILVTGGLWLFFRWLRRWRGEG